MKAFIYNTITPKYKLIKMAKEISISFNRPEVSTGEIVHGRIQLNYQGRFDSLVINSQIENSDDNFRILNFNGNNVNYPYARLSIWKEEIGNKQTLDFATVSQHHPTKVFSKAKFRVSIIQEHKEIVSDTISIKITKSPTTDSNTG
jgi:hypothetical protein